MTRPQKKAFAAKYIMETVDCFSRATKNIDCLPSEECELRWAFDVLCEYFDVAGGEKVIEEARAKFDAVRLRFGDSSCCLIPRKIGESKPSVTYDQFLELARARKSVRHYLQKPVPRAVIDNAVQVALQSPSACNRQAFEFIVIEDRERIQRVANIPFGADTFSDNIPALAVVIGNLSAYALERDRHLIYIDASLASMGLIYALQTQGVGTCCINFPEIDSKDRAMAAELGLEPYKRVILLIAIGYPDPKGMVACSLKKPVDEIRRYM